MSEEKTANVLEEEKLALLVPILKSIHVALDGYDDIFSDFDVSHYSSRAVSDDFLKEMKKRYYENKKGDFELRFMLPAAKRDTKIEHIIKKRLKDYFKGQVDYFEDRIGKIKKEGLLRIGIGFVLLSLEAVIQILHISDIYATILGVLIVPAGWYGFYSGFEHLFESSRDFESQLMFNEKCYKAKYEFVSEEDLIKTVEAAGQKAAEQKQQEQKGAEQKGTETKASSQ